jgi:hypothetical protein
MSSLFRQRALWTGFSGAPGYTNFYWELAPSLPMMLKFFQAIAYALPRQVTITVDAGGDVFNTETAELTGGWNAPVGGIVPGSGDPGPYSGASGIVVDWLAGQTVIRGRRLQGRTYFVPLVSGAYDGSGALQPAVRQKFLLEAGNMFGNVDNQMAVWSRPAPAHTTKRGKVWPAHPGIAGTVTDIRVPNIAAVLRSRRG